jgi:hypothetical protein
LAEQVIYCKEAFYMEFLEEWTKAVRPKRKGELKDGLTKRPHERFSI